MAWNQTQNFLYDDQCFCSILREQCIRCIFIWVSLIVSHISVVIYLIMAFESLLIATLRSLTCIIKNNIVLLSWLIVPTAKKSNILQIKGVPLLSPPICICFKLRTYAGCVQATLAEDLCSHCQSFLFSQSLQWHLVITKSALLLALSLSTFTCLSYYPGVSWKACW